MAQRDIARVTPEEYLAAERAAETRSEYFDGRIDAMAGASEAHALIVAAISYQLFGALQTTQCRVVTNDMQVSTPGRSGILYPDVAVYCSGDSDAVVKNVLLRPHLIIEVLSGSTEHKDRGEKFAFYQQIPSLQHYLLVSQNRIAVEHYARQGEDKWLYTTYLREAQEVVLPIPDSERTEVRLRLDEIYARVDLAAAESEA